MKTFLNPFDQLGGFEDMVRSLRERGLVSLTGCIDAAKPHLMYALGRVRKKRLMITYQEQRARELYEDYSFFEPEAVYYPAKDILFYQSDIRGNLLTAERMRALKTVQEQSEVTLVTTFDALMNTLMKPQRLAAGVLMLAPEDIVDLEELSNHLVQLGYEKEYQVSAAGQFAVRGGIIDIFPLTEENPVRIELWDDEIDTIRSFDVGSQKSIERLEYLTVYPAGEVVLSQQECREGTRRMQRDAEQLENKFRNAGKPEEAHRVREHADELAERWEEIHSYAGMDAYLSYFNEQKSGLLEYFDPKDTVILFDELSRSAEHGRMTEVEFTESMKMRLEQGYILPGQMNELFLYKEVLSRLESYPVASFAALDAKPNGLHQRAVFDIGVQGTASYNGSFEMLVKDLKHYRKMNYRIVLLSGSRTHAKRLADDLMEEGLAGFYTEDYDHELLPGQIMVCCGNVHKGYEYPQLQFAVITENDIFGAKKKPKRKKRYTEGEKIAGFHELSAGDYVVHENHGIGIYQGIEKMEVDGVEKDYIKISYAGESNLYILATQLELIQKYAAKDTSKAPKLNRLGGQEWTKTRTRVHKAVQEIAQDLVELYAARERQEGFVYGPDTVWQTEFEEMFPYEETADQILAIEATKRDMESPKIMDRLICGDVGYGKTEIAIRAAFKAVQDGKQVAYLAPTTILAQQIYNTFTQRMKDYPVRVDLLCRFRSAAQQKKTITDLGAGRVDIVIGTHRILSKDVEFKDLGLLVIDEEQRFGVRHKERIKQLKTNIDVLTLTATPIPRTLHMSLIGIRDMSLLEEPPLDRVPIQTYVMEYNEEMVREAISRELSRDGQVYFVYNRVRDIADMAAKVQALVPGANVAFAHGQMKETELERIMYDFINGEIDVLVSTTIIETGMDISNVNTMIICDADNMGLAQLYQLRGRVGRSNRTAYAFLMYRRDKMLREVAEKRLAAIREFTELGSGVKIAMRDLEIRGAGSLLGEQQSGHMEAVGYDLYCKMLHTAVSEAKGETVGEPFETAIDIRIDAFIPPAYISDEIEKLDMYKRIAGIQTEEEAEEMLEELIDRFGEPPKSVQNLLTVARLKVAAHHVYIKEITQRDRQITVKLFERAELDAAKIPIVVEKFAPAMSFVPDAKNPRFVYDGTKTRGNVETVALLQEIIKVLE